MCFRFDLVSCACVLSTKCERHNRPLAAWGHMVPNPTYWKVKEFDRSPLGNVNKEKWHFSSHLSFILEFSTFFCALVWRIFYHVTSSCKIPINCELSIFIVVLQAPRSGKRIPPPVPVPPVWSWSAHVHCKAVLPHWVEADSGEDHKKF